MRVRILTTIAGEPTYAFGEIADLPDALALVWIAESIAERADVVERAVDERPVETRRGRKR